MRRTGIFTVSQGFSTCSPLVIHNLKKFVAGPMEICTLNVIKKNRRFFWPFSANHSMRLGVGPTQKQGTTKHVVDHKGQEELWIPAQFRLSFVVLCVPCALYLQSD